MDEWRKCLQCDEVLADRNDNCCFCTDSHRTMWYRTTRRLGKEWRDAKLAEARSRAIFRTRNRRVDTKRGVTLPPGMERVDEIPSSLPEGDRGANVEKSGRFCTWSDQGRECGQFFFGPSEFCPRHM